MSESSKQGGRVRIVPAEATQLIASYRQASDAFMDRGGTLENLVIEAANLLGRQPPLVPLNEIGESLRSDADQLSDFLELVERLDGLAVRLDALPNLCLSATCANDTYREFLSFARRLTRSESVDELIEAVDDMTTSGAFGAEGVFTTGTIPRELRPIFATAYAIAMDHGWWNDDLPFYVAAGIPAYGDPNPATALSLAHLLATDRSYQPFETSANPFDLQRSEGMFGPVVSYLEEHPEIARRFISDLLAEDPTHRALHAESAPRSDHVARIILAAGNEGTDVEARTSFANHLIQSLNSGDAISSEVFWATWAVHADLALSHDVQTTTPTFPISRAVPEAIRPHWERLWNSRISPTLLKFLSGSGDTLQKTLVAFATPLLVNATFNDEEFPRGPGNDPGGTFTTRTLFEAAEAVDVRSPTTAGDGVSPADRGRRVISQALRDVSPEGPIARDEFAIIDHGVLDGVSTYSVLLPGVIDLSKPSPGFDPVHATVRDIDEVAIHSAPTASVDDNRYAQMVIAGLDVLGVEPRSNVMLVGHSFGADTVLDIAADEQFNSQYNLTHVVAAAYDSVPQLAAVPTSIDVLVLQNESDQAIALERFHRDVGQGDESVSINTFAHEVREFAGGLGSDLGHHPDRYIEYVNNTRDSELDRFFESIEDTGYTTPGATLAVDVSVQDE